MAQRADGAGKKLTTGPEQDGNSQNEQYIIDHLPGKLSHERKQILHGAHKNHDGENRRHSNFPLQSLVGRQLFRFMGFFKCDAPLLFKDNRLVPHRRNGSGDGVETCHSGIELDLGAFRNQIDIGGDHPLRGHERLFHRSDTGGAVHPSDADGDGGGLLSVRRRGRTVFLHD